MAYVNLVDSSWVGTLRKIEIQAEAIRQDGIPLDCLLFNFDPDYQNSSFKKVIHIRREKRLWKTLLGAYRQIKQEVEGYDVVILRYLIATPIFWWSFRRRNFKLITEHHHKEGVTGLRSGRWKSIVLETLFGRKCLTIVDGLIGVADEIRDYQVARRGWACPSLSVPNGIAVRSIPFTQFIPFDGQRLIIVLVATNGNFPWHGGDRIIEGIKNYMGPLKIELHLVGDYDREKFVDISTDKKVFVHGMLKGKALDLIMGRANVAIGTLALHRNGMVEASPLKTREYMARGIPFLKSYHDNDIPDDFEFVLNIPPTEDLVEVKTIQNFLEKIQSQYRPSEISSRMREFAENQMNWSKKLKTYVSFAERVLHE